MKDPNLGKALALLTEDHQVDCLKVLVEHEDVEATARALSGFIWRMKPNVVRNAVTASVLWDSDMAPHLVSQMICLLGAEVKQGCERSILVAEEAVLGLIRADILLDPTRSNPGMVLPATIVAMACMGGAPLPEMEQSGTGSLATLVTTYLRVSPDSDAKRLRQFVCKVSAGLYEAARMLEICRGKLPFVIQLALEFSIKSRSLFAGDVGICDWIKGTHEALRLYTNKLGITGEEMREIFDASHRVISGSVWPPAKA